MILFPAIDLKQGQCVRLEKGKMERATIFHQDPTEQARIFETQGFDWLHVINLDGAVGENNHRGNHNVAQNADVIKEILRATSLKVQIGGGIRTLSHIRFWLERGAARVILGTLALSEPEIARQACRDFPGQIVIALDGQEGWLAVQGWQTVSREKVLDAAKRIGDWAAAAILYTDIARDGMMAGLNIKATAALSEVCQAPVIASGGLRDIDDLKKLVAYSSSSSGKDKKNGTIEGVIEGVIAGRALYEGALDPSAALRLLAKSC